MTTHDTIQYLREQFESGERWIEIPTDEPRKLYTRLRYKAYECQLHWRYQLTENSLIVRPDQDAAPKPEKKRAVKCTCRDYGNCMECRNREKRDAEKDNRMPVYLLGKIDPDVLAICAAIAAKG